MGFWGFGGVDGLSEAQSWQLLRQYNDRLGEKWAEKDLQHKVRCALRALAWGSPEVVIADGAADRALDRALNDPGFGTRSRSAG